MPVPQLKPSDFVRGSLEKARDKYSFWELGMWVHMFTTRAANRKTLDARKRDLYDARDYLKMMDNKLKELEKHDET